MVNARLMLDGFLSIYVILNYSNWESSMIPDLSSPLYFVAGAAFFTALTFARWPKIGVRTERQRHNGIEVIDVMFTVFGRGPPHVRSGSPAPDFEFSIYIVSKRKK